MKKPKVAIVYDWVTTPYGGAEQVLLALHHVFPDAPLFTSIYNKKVAQWASVFEVKTTFLQHFPLAKRYFRAYGWLMPLAFETLDFSAYDLIISVTSSFAKSIITQPHQHHVTYLLTPNRHLYSHRAQYEQQMPSLLHFFFTGILNYLQAHDQLAAQRPDTLIAISQLVANRSQEYYHRSGTIVYPPVSIKKNYSRKNNPEYYLVVARLVAYKEIALALKACQQLGKNLIVVGTGPELGRLQQLARSSSSRSQITFLENVDQSHLEDLYAGAIGVLMPGLEDFGITAVEAVGRGVPVILHHQSGAAEIIRHEKEGIHLANSSLAELVKAMHTLEMTAWDPVIMIKQVEQYSTTHFQKKFKGEIL